MPLIESASSLKGLAWLGTLLGVLVFAVLLPLGIFASDDEKKEPKGSAAVRLEENDLKIQALKESIVSATERLAKLEKLRELKAKVAAAKGSNEVMAGSIAELREDIQVIEWSAKDYAEQYRSKIRAEAQGKKLDVLTTAAGNSYHDVKVVKVDALGMSILHRDGSRRIPYDELSAEMQDYYQFSKEEALSVKQSEQVNRDAHNRALAAVKSSNRQQEEQQAREQAREEEQKRRAAIRTLVSHIQSLSSEIKSLNRQILVENDKRLSRVPQLRQQLNELNARKREMQARLQQLLAQR